jgi:hypothetical protein
VPAPAPRLCHGCGEGTDECPSRPRPHPRPPPHRSAQALLWLGKAALESVRDSAAYQDSKESIEIEKALQQSAVAYAPRHATPIPPHASPLAAPPSDPIRGPSDPAATRTMMYGHVHVPRRRGFSPPPIAMLVAGGPTPHRPMPRGSYDEEDAKRRAAFARRVPPEPAEGAAGSTKLCAAPSPRHGRAPVSRALNPGRVDGCSPAGGACDVAVACTWERARRGVVSSTTVRPQQRNASQRAPRTPHLHRTTLHLLHPSNLRRSPNPPSHLLILTFVGRYARGCSQFCAFVAWCPRGAPPLPEAHRARSHAPSCRTPPFILSPPLSRCATPSRSPTPTPTPTLHACPQVREGRELRLLDVTTRPAKPLDVDSQLGLTLKYLGLWPSGQVRCRVDGQDEAFEEASLGLVRLPSEDRA